MEPVGEHQGRSRAADIGHDNKLITTESDEEILRSDDRRQSLGHALEQDIADRVALRVVDQLEPVKVDEQHRRRSSAVEQRRLEAIHQRDAIG